jgi:hypothetical protein
VDVAQDAHRDAFQRKEEAEAKRLMEEQGEKRQEAEASKEKHQERIAKARAKSIKRRSRLSMSGGEMSALDAALAVAGQTPHSPLGGGGDEPSINEVKSLAGCDASPGSPAAPTPISPLPTSGGAAVKGWTETDNQERFTFELRKVAGQYRFLRCPQLCDR